MIWAKHHRRTTSNHSKTCTKCWKTQECDHRWNSKKRRFARWIINPAGCFSQNVLFPCFKQQTSGAGATPSPTTLLWRYSLCTSEAFKSFLSQASPAIQSARCSMELHGFVDIFYFFWYLWGALTLRSHICIYLSLCVIHQKTVVRSIFPSPLSCRRQEAMGSGRCSGSRCTGRSSMLDKAAWKIWTMSWWILDQHKMHTRQTHISKNSCSKVLF